MFNRLRKRLKAQGPATPIAVLALAIAVAFAGVPAMAQPVANTSANFAALVKRALGLAGVANKRALTANKRALTANKRAVIANKRAIFAIKNGGQPGPEGPQGPKGDKGDKGDAGSDGAEGDTGARGPQGPEGPEGAEGQAGESVEAFPTAGDEGEPCEGTGGVVYEVEATPTEICNGEDGSPWTAGGTLPPGATETGTWAFNGSASDETAFGGESFPGVAVPISFPIPLAGLLAKVDGDTHIVGPFGEGPSGICKGNVQIPKAPEGQLCVYEGALHGVTPGPEDGLWDLQGGLEGVSRTGGFLYFENVTDGSSGYGSWAVTGG